ncbi:MAG TPA: ketoacyl-ACP synthase III, partial [Gemmataceae bacterium]
MSTSLGVMLLGTGSCLPARVLRNADFPASLDTSDEWIRSRTGIQERRIAGSDETSASLGLEASRRALEAARLRAADVDMIICATVTSDMLVPANACLIQAGLGCRPIPAFDLNAACTGFLYGLAVAAQFVRTGACRHVL